MSRIQKAGAIAIDRSGTRPLYLVVTAKETPGHWVLPKGHVEQQDASPRETAIRELFEETGITATLLDDEPIDTIPIEGADVAFFLVSPEPGAVTGGPSAEGREIEWLELDDALKRLTFDDTRRLLAAAATAIGDS